MKMFAGIMAMVVVLALGAGVSAKDWTVEYDEPTKNEAGTVLGSVPGVSLSKTQIKPTYNGVPMAVIDVPATQAAGGGHIKKILTTADTAVCGKATLVIVATAWNAVKESGNVAIPNPTATAIEDKGGSDPCLKPVAPSGLTVTPNP